MKIRRVRAHGVDLEVVEHPAVGASGDSHQKLALLLHGFPESSYSWRYQIPLLAELGYRVWAPNLRGYGGSSRPQAVAEYSMRKLVEDVAALIDTAGAEETLLVGHDWGGAIAWMFALETKRPLEGLVVMNLPHPAIFRQKVTRLPQLARSWYAVLFQLPWLPEIGLGAGGAWGIEQVFRQTGAAIPEEAIRRYRRLATESGAVRAMVNYYRAAMRVPLDPKQRAAIESQLDTPTLLIWGEEDVALGKELTHGTDRLVRDFTVRYLPGVSHWVQQEAPDDVNRLLANWLADQRAAREQARSPSGSSRELEPESE